MTTTDNVRQTTEESPVATTAPAIPDVLTEEHHEAITRSWELPAYARPTEPANPSESSSNRSLYAGLIAGALGLAIGAGVGYFAGTQQATVTTVREPYAVSAPAAAMLTDANGMTLGRRIAPMEVQPPTALAAAMPTDANGMTLGRRIAPTET